MAMENGLKQPEKKAQRGPGEKGWACYYCGKEGHLKWDCQSLSCVLLCNPMDCSPPGSSVRGLLQARILEWVAILGDLPDPGIEPVSPALQADSSPSESPGKP